ncbi:MAG: hypothetical protein GY794_06030 [bacterium]|nr:hypothetical protein [bacterium]
MLTKHLAHGLDYRGIDVAFLLQRGQNISAVFLERLFEILGMLAVCMAQGLCNVLVGEHVFPGIGIVKRPKQQPSDSIILLRVWELDTKTLTPDMIHAILILNGEIRHHLPLFGDMNVDIS